MSSRVAAVELAAQMRTVPFSEEALDGKVNLAAHNYMEIPSSSRLYPLVCAYICSCSVVKSLRFAGANSAPDDEEDDEDQEQDLASAGGAQMTLGLGLFSFPWGNLKLHALHQALGHPMGSGCGVDVYTTLVLFAPVVANKELCVLSSFCGDLLAASERTRDGRVTIFQWDARGQYWNSWRSIRPRPVSSVILPMETKRKFMEDLSEFMGADTRAWYRQHGIPHKRGYLFFGAPGSGKTSLIQAAAGHFRRSVCYLHLSHPELTDDSLRAAVDQAPRRSVLVLEDVDAVFGPNREKLIKESPLSFSGLLNALDGVGGAHGQVFILTTNHRDRLNSALIRNGRADVHIEFAQATDEQIMAMFLRFYPAAGYDLAEKFVLALRRSLGDQELSMAMLQHYFIQKRKCRAEAALQQVADLSHELALREDEKAQPRSAKPLRSSL